MIPGGKADKENENNENSPAVLQLKNRSSSSTSGSLRKSLIPKPVTSPSNDENSGASLDNAKTRRRPLSEVQNADSPRLGHRKSEKIVSKDKSTPQAKPKASRPSTKDESTLTPISSASKLKLSTGVPKTPQNSPSRTKLKLKGAKKIDGAQKDAQTTTTERAETKHQDKEESLAYWKELAESRRQALEDALKENYELHQRVQELEKEKVELEALVVEAEKLATLVSQAAEELEESGICESEAVDNNSNQEDETVSA